MRIRNDLILRPEDKGKLTGYLPLPLTMPQEYACKTSGLAYARQLAATGAVVCLGCELGPCALPEGVEPGRELRIMKERGQA